MTAREPARCLIRSKGRCHGGGGNWAPTMQGRGDRRIGGPGTGSRGSSEPGRPGDRGGPPQKAGGGDFLRAVAEAIVPLPTETGAEGPIGAGRHGRPRVRLAVALSPIPLRGPEGRLARDVGQREGVARIALAVGRKGGGPAGVEHVGVDRDDGVAGPRRRRRPGPWTAA